MSAAVPLCSSIATSAFVETFATSTACASRTRTRTTSISISPRSTSGGRRPALPFAFEGRRMTRARWITLAVGTAIALAVAVALGFYVATLKGSPYIEARTVGRPFQGRQVSSDSGTARADLARTIATMEDRLARTATDSAAAVTLAD